MSLIAFAVIAALGGQDASVSPDCLDDNLTNRCDADRRAATLVLFSAPTIEQDAESGAEVYRVLSVDGYGQDLPVIAFERRPGASPQAVVYAAGGRTLKAVVGMEVWRRVQREARFSDQLITSERLEVNGREMPPMCLHSWVVTVEMANSRLDRSRRVPVRRRTEDTCTGGLTTQSAFGLADLAMDAFPQCRELNEGDYRSVAHRLGACSALNGDVPAAAEVRNHLTRVQHGRSGETASDFWRRYTGLNAVPTVSWDGETAVGRLHGSEVSDFLAAKVQAHSVNLAPEAITGLDAREVMVTGTLVSFVRPGERGSPAGVYSQTWAFSDPAQNWTLKSMTVTLGAKAD